ncbi:MAG: hypothetical protein R3192_17930 [Woeseiaceae bacterium]|nr:hypothetical protein [Woeseiaceae bacterium]
MRRLIIALAVIGVASLFTAERAVAGSEAIRTMAKITMGLNHFPSEDDKAALNAIVDSDEASDDEAAIAMALANIQHKVTEADAKRLKEVVDDRNSDADARKLAGIVLSVNHSPSAEDKAALETLAAN